MQGSAVSLAILLCLASILATRTPIASGSAMIISVNPTRVDASVGIAFEVGIDICNAAGVNAWEIFLYFDPAIIKLDSYVSGGFLAWFGSVSPLLFSDKSILGHIEAGQSLDPLKPEGANGNGTLINLVFAVIGTGNCSLHLFNTALYDYALAPIIHATADGFLSADSGSVKTIFIRPDGSLDPNTAPVQRDGSVYTLTANLVANVNFSGIVIERDDVVFDGASYVLQGDQWSGNAVASSGRGNVTIKNVKISGFLVGILLESCPASNLCYNIMDMCGHAGVLLDSSNLSTLTGNSLYACGNGIILDASSNAAVLCNNVSACRNVGLLFNSSVDSLARENRLRACLGCGIFLAYSFNVTISHNEILANHVGVYVYESSGNMVCHNNFIYNYMQDVQIGTLNCTNRWDDGYLSGGNFWTGYNWTDTFSGPYQNITGADGINDEPCVFDEYNIDRYPLMNEVAVDEFYSVALMPLFALLVSIARVLLRRKQKRG